MGPRGVPWPSRGVPWPLYEDHSLEHAISIYYCPPSWICYLQLQAWTIHEEYSVVFITAQSLVGIGAIVSIRYAIADI